MSLTTPYREQFLEADGKTVNFSYNDHGDGFDAISKNYVKCEIYNTDGTVIVPTIEVNTSTQSVKIVSLKTPDGKILNAPQAGSIVRIYRDVPEAQNTTVQALQQSTASQIVNNFDNIVGMIQELQYSDKHFTIRSTLPQRDLQIQFLSESDDKKLISWDNENRKLVVSEYRQDQIVLSDTVKQIKSENGRFYYFSGGKWSELVPRTVTDDLQEQVDDINQRTKKNSSDIEILYDTKIDKDQGKVNVGKVLTVEGDGIVRPRVSQGGGGIGGVIAHDDTLFGAGTDEYPLGVKDKTTITIVDWE